MISDAALVEMVRSYETDAQSQSMRERYVAALKDRIIDVVAVINEPFSYADVAVNVTRVMLADGWPGRLDASNWETTRSVMREMVDAQLITKVRDSPGSRPHLFVRTRGRRYAPFA